MDERGGVQMPLRFFKNKGFGVILGRGEKLMTDIALEMRNITKQFPGVKALDNVTFQVKKGHVHALCGENGAGKSTLMKVLSGLYPTGTYEGQILIDGKEMSFHNIKDAVASGDCHYLSGVGFGQGADHRRKLVSRQRTVSIRRYPMESGVSGNREVAP